MQKQGIINCIILTLAAGLLALAYRLLQADGLLFAAIGCGTAVYHYAMRLIMGKISEMLFPRHLNAGSIWFRQKAWEPKLYRLLRVRHWKNKLPTAYPEAYSLQHRTLEQIIQNTCHAELSHEMIALLSFVPLTFSLIWGAFPLFLITSLLAAGSDLIFAVMQRYNRPRLQKVLARRK